MLSDGLTHSVKFSADLLYKSELKSRTLRHMAPGVLEMHAIVAYLL
jgi:hypothetical protein